MQILREVLVPHLAEVLTEAGLQAMPWQRMLGVARESAQGDLALPCFPFAKIAGKAPALIAEELAEALNNRMSLDDNLASVLQPVAAAAGYLNFLARPSWLASVLLQSCDESTGRGPDRNHRVLIEHTSANPNGPFHVGRARNAILGDTLVRLHRLHGHEVNAEYYVDDMGKQVGILSWAMDNLTFDRVTEVLEEAGRKVDLGPWGEKEDHLRVLWYQAANLIKEQDASVDAEVGE